MAETTELHAEDRGDTPYTPPVLPVTESREYGEFFYQTPYTDHHDTELERIPTAYDVNRLERNITEKRYDQLRPMFLFTSKEVIKKTLSSTTQFGKILMVSHSITSK